MDIREPPVEIKKTANTSLVSQWLLPHMTRRALTADKMLFRKDAAANSMIYVASGEVRMDGMHGTPGPGDLIGKIGLFFAGQVMRADYHLPH